MTNKIVILERSVELYEHYIDDERWERTLSFPRGGLTYLISNGTIKFYAYIDYLYRNCLMSMQLPIYIVDEKRGIDGEYSDVDEIIEILDPIFPSNDIDAELEYYLTKREAEITYQPIGDYVTTDELDEVLDDYYTKDETDDLLDGKADKDDVYTKDETDDLLDGKADKYNVYTIPEADDLLDDKLDITAYTPFDPSSYYTKIEVDNKIASADTFDPDQYYNKSESDTRFALKNEIPSLSGYATEEWVLNKNYVTNSTIQQYINNLQQQITSIMQSVSGCCSQTGETIYRWITLTGPNDYICSGTTKYEKQQKQQSTDNGMTWTNVSPAEYQKGAVLETSSSDCGYAPEPQYRWKAAPTNDYLCSGTSKYYKVYYEVSYDNGQTWQHVQPEQTKRGNLIEANSPDCGYIAPQYRWKAAPTSDYLCSGTSKYYKVYYEVSYDNGSTWQHVQPEQTKRGDLIEANSPDCGYVPTSKFSGVLHNGKTVSIDCNSSSILSKEEVYTTNGYVSIEIGSCVTSIAEKAFLNQTYLTGVTIPSNVKSIGYMSFANTGISALTLNEGIETLGNGAFKHTPNLKTVIIPNSVKQLVGDTFYVNKIKTLIIGSGVTSIGRACFERTSLTGSTITVLATTPPTIENNSPIFEGWDDAPIYVPAGSLNAYKTASGWNRYASQIRAINS